MMADLYQQMAKVEDTHWWFRGRRTIVTDIIRRMDLPEGATILDAGSGTGGNLEMLSKFGHVFAMEMDGEARRLADARGIVTVEPGEMPDNIPFGQMRFDLIVMFDVLEHIEQDFNSLAALHGRLAEGGRLLLTVPAFELLWSMHDTMHHHKRRYGVHPLTRLLERAGYRVTFASYINFWLFPFIAALRILDRISGGRIIGKKVDSNAELSIPPKAINATLEKLFASESGIIRRFGLPFGVSIVALAEKI